MNLDPATLAGAAGSLTPWGAGLSAVSGLASGGPSSAETGDTDVSSHNPFGAISFGGYKSNGEPALPSWVMPAAIVFIGVVAVSLLRK